MSETMTCATCGKQKHRYDGFPVTYYAQCWQCAWDRHAASAHPLSRSKRREIRRIARSIASKKLLADARNALDAGLLVDAALKSESGGVGEPGTNE